MGDIRVGLEIPMVDQIQAGASLETGMLGLARALSLEGAEHGIKTSCILPVAPFRNRGPIPAALSEQLNNAGLPPQSAGPELVAPMVVYLASAACSVTGEAFSAGGNRFGRVFIGVADGWINPSDSSATTSHLVGRIARYRSATPQQAAMSAV